MIKGLLCTVQVLFDISERDNLLIWLRFKGYRSESFLRVRIILEAIHNGHDFLVTTHIDLADGDDRLLLFSFIEKDQIC